MANSFEVLADSEPPDIIVDNRKPPPVPTGTATAKTRHEMLLRMESSGKKNSSVNVHAVVKSTMAAMMIADPTIEIHQQYGDTNRRISANEFPSEETEFKKFFQIVKVESKRGVKVIIGMKITADIRLTQIKSKNDGAFLEHLKTQNVFIVENKFKSLRLTGIGVIVFKSHNLTWRPAYEQQLRKHLLQKLPTELQGTLPDFELQSRSSTIYQKSSKTRVTTNVLEIKCEVNNRTTLRTLLCEAQLPVKQFGEYLPYGVTDSDKYYPEKYSQQNHFLSKVRCIPVYGLAKEAMESRVKTYSETDPPRATMKDRMLEGVLDNEAKKPIVIAIEETMDTETKGKWFVLCMEENMQQVRHYIDNSLPHLYTESLIYADIANKYKTKYPKPCRGDYHENVDRYAAAPTPLPAFITVQTTTNNDQEQQAATTEQRIHRRPPKRHKQRGQIVYDNQSTETHPSLQKGSWAQIAKHRKKQDSEAAVKATTKKTQDSTTTTVAASQTSNTLLDDTSTTLASQNSAMEGYIDRLRAEFKKDMQEQKDLFQEQLEQQQAQRDFQQEKNEANIKSLQADIEDTKTALQSQSDLLKEIIGTQKRQTEQSHAHLLETSENLEQNVIASMSNMFDRLRTDLLQGEGAGNEQRHPEKRVLHTPPRTSKTAAREAPDSQEEQKKGRKKTNRTPINRRTYVPVQCSIESPTAGMTNPERNYEDTSMDEESDEASNTKPRTKAPRTLELRALPLARRLQAGIAAEKPTDAEAEHTTSTIQTPKTINKSQLLQEINQRTGAEQTAKQQPSLPAWAGHVGQPSTRQPETAEDAPVPILPTRYQQQLFPIDTLEITATTEGETTTRVILNLPHGDSLDKPPEDGNYRCYFQNVNGVSAANTFQDAAEIGFMASNNWIDTLGMAETKLDFSMKKERKVFARQLQQFWNPSSLTTASSPINCGSVHQPGGVAQITGGIWASRICHQGNDPSGLGRWATTTLQGKGGKKFTTITAYQVCDNSISRAGPTTAYTQQWTMLRHKGCPEPDPRARFRTDLESTITALIDDAHEVLLMLDANEALSTATSPLGIILGALGLVDLHRHRHQEHDDPPTHMRGSQRIDFIYGTEAVADVVRRAGIEAFHEGVKYSDHRGMFVDLELELMLGAPVQLATAPHRGVQSTQPDVVLKYRQEVMTYLDQHKVAERAMTARHDTTSEQASDNIIEGIDRDMTRAMIHAEKKYGRRFPLPWSKQLMAAKRTVRYWALWMTELRTHRDFAIQRHKIAREIPSLHHINSTQARPTFKAAKQEMQASRKCLRAEIRQAKTRRNDMLDKRVEAEALCSNKPKEKIARRIRAAEQTRAKYSRINTARGKHHTGGIKFILVPSTTHEGQWEAIFDPVDITARLMDRNRKHFGQADGTPFTIGDLKYLLEWDSVTPAGDAIVAGEFDLDKVACDEASKAILQHLNDTVPLPAIDDDITADDLKQGFKKWNERTSTSPSNRHLGHYKAMLSYDTEPDDGGPSQGTSFYMILADLIGTCVQRGYVLERWKTVYNALIEKMPGIPRITKLRVIHLFEADFNLTIGILWGRRMLYNAESHDSLGDEQFGSRPGRTAIDLVLLKHMTYMMSHMTKSTLGTFDNDAKSCYDRIVIPLAMLISRCLGVPSNAIKLHANFLKHARYHLKTKMGVSDEWYSNFESAILGTGQGSRASPVIWAAISAVIIELVRDKSNGITLTDPFLHDIIQRWMDGFVDDTTAWVNMIIEELRDVANSEEHYGIKISVQLQEMAQWWEQLLHATGGKLELEKCLYYIMHWKFDKQGVARLSTPDELQHQIEIHQSEDQTLTEITHQDCRKSHRTLGVMENPSGDYSDEAVRLKKKAHTLTQHLLTNSLRHGDAVTLYWTIFLTGMGYSLPVMTFDKKTLHSCQSYTLQVLLPFMGYQKTTPHDIVFGPWEEGGIGLRHLEVEQGTGQIMAFLRHGRHGGKLGRTIRVCVQWFQLIAGVSYDTLANPQDPIPHAIGDWIISIRQYLQKSELTIRYSQPVYRVTPRRTRDRILMDDAVSWLSPSHACHVNRARLYLQVETLADVSTTDGKYLQASVLATKPATPSVLSQSTQLWPRQGLPGSETWRVWRKFLHEYTRDANITLTDPMGKWHDTGRRQWPAYYDPSENCVVIAHIPESPNEAVIYADYHKVSSTDRHHYFFDAEVLYQDVSSRTGFIPTTVTWARLKAQRVEEPTTSPSSDNAPTAPHSLNRTVCFQSHIEQLPPWESTLLDGNRERAPGMLLDCLLEPRDRTIYMVHDGGHDGDYGSYGWVLATDDNILWEGWGAARGCPMQSFRAEGYGRMAASTFLHHYIKFYGITLPTNLQFQFHTDSLSLLKRRKAIASKTVDSPFDHMLADQDVIKTFMWRETESELPITNHFVKGHQDDKKPLHALSRPEYLNYLADGLATYALVHQMEHGPPPPMIPLPRCEVYLAWKSGELLTSHDQAQLRRRLPAANLRKYLIARWQWTTASYTQIDWKAFTSARRAIAPAERIFVTRYCINWLPVGTRLRKYGNAHGHCPLCQAPEDYDHMFLCRNRQEWQTTFSLALDTELKSLDTAADMRTVIIAGLSQWMTRTKPMTKLASSFDDLTWSHFMRGFIDSGWTACQERFYRSQRADKNTHTGQIWTTRLILFLWRQSRALWKIRCTDLFTDTPLESARDLQELSAKTRALYDVAHLLNVHDRQIFDRPIEATLRQPIRLLRIWIRNTIPTVKRGLRDASAQAILGVQDIRNFFERRQPP